MPVKKTVLPVLLSLILFCGCGKKHWEPSWREAGPLTASASADQLYSKAWEKFQQAMKYSERSMYVNPHFRAAVERGQKPWETAPALQAEDAPAMLFWVVALQYEFKEGMTLAAKIINVGWMKYGISFLESISRVAPDFGNGAVEFAYSICYSALPFFLGGDTDLGKVYLERSIDKGKGYLLPRWGRGKYFYQVTGDRRSARQDLEWVAGQKPEACNDPYPWRIHFITDAAVELDALKRQGL
jgi:hypothetical protein